VRLVSWNVARKLQRLPDQAARVIHAEPDLVALQEVTAASAPLWTHALATIGLTHVALSAVREKRHRVLLAAREPIEPVDVIPAPWQEAVLSADVAGIRVHVCHVPNANNGWVKIRTFEAIVAGLEAEGERTRLLCGDLNTPRREFPELRSFAYDSYQRLRPERGEEWDAAELALFRGAGGLKDAFRTLHPEGKEPTWEWQRWGGGWRLDHLFVSPDIEPVEVDYRHDWRKAGLSDHSALEAVLRPPRRASAGRRSATS
jgi:exodeoxyribonuclease III